MQISQSRFLIVMPSKKVLNPKILWSSLPDPKKQIVERLVIENNLGGCWFLAREKSVYHEQFFQFWENTMIYGKTFPKTANYIGKVVRNTGECILIMYDAVQHLFQMKFKTIYDCSPGNGPINFNLLGIKGFPQYFYCPECDKEQVLYWKNIAEKEIECDCKNKFKFEINYTESGLEIKDAILA